MGRATVSTYCLDRMAELPKSKSTEGSYCSDLPCISHLTLVSVPLGGAQPPPLPDRRRLWCQCARVRQPAPVVTATSRIVPEIGQKNGGKFELQDDYVSIRLPRRWRRRLGWRVVEPEPAALPDSAVSRCGGGVPLAVGPDRKGEEQR